MYLVISSLGSLKFSSFYSAESPVGMGLESQDSRTSSSFETDSFNASVFSTLLSSCSSCFLIDALPWSLFSSASTLSLIYYSCSLFNSADFSFSFARLADSILLL
jgi:hypothetical protein